MSCSLGDCIIQSGHYHRGTPDGEEVVVTKPKFIAMDRPLIISANHYVRKDIGIPSEYRLVWEYDHMDEKVYAKWWIAWLLRAAMDFTYFYDVRSVEMRLDFPEWVRANEGCAVLLPTFAKVNDFIQRHKRLLWVRRA